MRSATQPRGWAWSTRDILVTAVIALVFAVALLPIFYLSPVMDATLGPVVKRLTSGLFLIPGMLAAYALRKPGAALLCTLLVGLVQFPFTPFGLLLVVGQAVFGIFYELPFLITRYRRYGTTMILVSGGVLGLLLGALDFVPNGALNLAPLAQVLFLTFNTLSGVLGGLVAKLLADALGRAGVLSGTHVSVQEV